MIKSSTIHTTELLEHRSTIKLPALYRLAVRAPSYIQRDTQSEKSEVQVERDTRHLIGNMAMTNSEEDFSQEKASLST